MTKNALIVGAGDGISASFARLLAANGWRVGLAARNVAKLEDLAGSIEAPTFACDAVDQGSVETMFSDTDRRLGDLDLVHYNPSARSQGSLIDLDPADVRNALAVTAFGGFLVAQQAARRMLPRGQGAIFFTGASASIKGYPRSAPFAMGKFALRGLAQSIARELAPQNIHVAHFVIDGAVRNERRGLVSSESEADKFLDPDAIAQSYLAVLQQHRSAWSWELELRPWVERF